ncbi:MAG: pyridoxal 5'-phosphate synthase glutaminase subunit PdxT, partial [Candidatus Nitrosothermus koennekii]
MKIGVLALQGDIEENINASKKALDNLNKDGIVLPVKYPNQIKEIDALIIPGGESTVIGLLSMLSNSTDIIIDRIKDGMPVLGTCAGMILLAKRAYDRVVGETKQPLLSLLDIVVERNAFGRQIDSFEAEISIDGIADRFNGVFIRAPIVAEYANNVKPIAKLGNKVVAVQQDNIIGTAF